MNTILSKYPNITAYSGDYYIHSTNFPFHRVEFFDGLYCSDSHPENTIFYNRLAIYSDFQVVQLL